MKLYKSAQQVILLIIVSVVFQAHITVAEQKTVLFDEGHGQRFLAEKNDMLDLSRLSQLIQEEGSQIKTSKGVITEQTLSGVDALVISGAFAPFSQTEIEAITHFIKNGGRLSVMLHIGVPVAGLLKELGVYVSNGVVNRQTIL